MSSRQVGQPLASAAGRVAMGLVLLVLMCLPLLTLASRDEVGRWTGNHNLMASPDEPSYALAARAVAEDGTLSTMGRAGLESFYPPGLPLLLGGWSRAVGPGIFSLHVCLAVCLCLSVGVAFFLVRRLLSEMGGLGGRWAEGLALLITAVYATNWYTLETALFVFSEPAFLLVTFSWLLFALRYPDWPRSPWQTCVLVALAVAAMAIRSAGMTCLATSFVYAFYHWSKSGRDAAGRWAAVYVSNLTLMVFIAAVYFGLVHYFGPVDTAHQATPYAQQLLRGITDGGSFQRALAREPVGHYPRIVLQWGYHLGHLAGMHFTDWAAGFMPPYRDDDYRPGLYATVAWFLWGACLLGLAIRLWGWRRNGKSGRSVFPELYLLFYVGLYTLWPFNMTRFWVPILPLMLSFLPLAMRTGDLGIGRTLTRPASGPARAHFNCTYLSPFSRPARGPCPCGSAHRTIAWPLQPREIRSKRGIVVLAVLLGLLVLLNGQELVLKLPYYQRRLNYVSDCLAGNAAVIRKASPTAAKTFVIVEGGDEQFLFSWYLGFPVHQPERGQHLEEAMLAAIRRHEQHPEQRVFLVSFFANDDFVGAFKNVSREHPELLGPAVDGVPLGLPPKPSQKWQPVRLAGREIITSVWELVPPL